MSTAAKGARTWTSSPRAAVPVAETVRTRERVASSAGSPGRTRSSSRRVAKCFPVGCGETFDPIGLYVRSVEDSHAQVHRLGDVYELTLSAGRVEQVVRISAKTYLPRLIEWLQDGRLVATIRFTMLQRSRARSQAEWSLAPHEGAKVVELTSDRRRVRIERVSPAKPSAAIRWLGPSYDGVRAKGGTGDAHRWNGDAHHLRPTARRVELQVGRAACCALKAAGRRRRCLRYQAATIVHAFFGLDARQVAVVTYGAENVGLVEHDRRSRRRRSRGTSYAPRMSLIARSTRRPATPR